MLAYNHEKFIAQAIDGVLMQQTNFDYELIIGEDSSPDNTLQICLEYEAKFPDKIRVLKREKNLGGGGQPNFIDCYKHTKDSKYFAFCEGDDYWTSPHKLQKQVDFLENNPDFASCFHNTEVVFFEGNQESYFLNENIERDVFSLDDLVGEDEIWFMATASVMHRRDAIGDLPEWFVKTKSGDIPLHILAARNGKIKYLPEPMAAYRKHPGGISLTDHKDNEVFLNNRIFMYSMLDKETGYKYHEKVNKNIARYYRMMLNSKEAKASNWHRLNIVYTIFKLKKVTFREFREILRDHLLPRFLVKTYSFFALLPQKLKR